MKTDKGEVKDITLDDCQWYTRNGNLINVRLNDEYWTRASGVLSDWQAEQMKDLPLSTRKSLDEIWKEWDLTREPLGDPMELMLKSLEEDPS